MARPKLSNEHRRSVNFTVRLTETELKQLEALAGLCGKAPGILVRDKVFKGRFPEPKVAKLDAQFYLELKRIGINLNQLLRKVNAGIMPQGLTGLLRWFKAQIVVTCL
jgi:hypothetical protein